MDPPAVGLDSSWNAGLAMATEQGLQFGEEIVFSYGPLGFLRTRGLWYGDLATISFLYGAILHISLCIGLIWSLRRILPSLVTVPIVFVVALLPLLELPLVLAVLAGMWLLTQSRSLSASNLFLLLGATFAAIESLIKLSTGPLVAVILLIALFGARERRWRVAGFIALFAAEALFLWMVTRQDLATVPAFLDYTREIVSGYSEAMPRLVDVPAWAVLAATAAVCAVALAFVWAGARGEYKDRRAHLAALAIAALTGFALFKQGVVRADAGHLSLFFSTACALWISLPWTASRWRPMLAGAAVIGLMGIPVRPPGQPHNLNALTNVAYAADQIEILLKPSRRSALKDAAREGMKATYRLDGASLATLRGHSVAVDPWETALVWAYDLNWAPLPVFQGYTAYTADLDRLNANAVAAPDGPDRILRENLALVYPEFPTRGIDERFPGWDPPAQSRAILCHFVPLRTTGRWQVLARVSNRCEPPRPAGAVEADTGTAIAVPAPRTDEIVFARIDGVVATGVERLSTLLARARIKRATINGDAAYRLVPGTAGDGLMLRRGRRLREPGGVFAQVPQAKSIEIDGTRGSVRIAFFRMQVR